MPVTGILVINNDTNFGEELKRGLTADCPITSIDDINEARDILKSANNGIKQVVFGMIDDNIDKREFARTVERLNPCIRFFDAIEYMRQGIGCFTARNFPKEPGNDIRKLVKIVSETIEKCYMNPISLKEIASMSNSISAKQLSYAFKQHHIENKTYSRVLMEKRISVAKSDLANTSRSIEDIAFSVGYKSAKKFYKAFKKITYMTPGEYRRCCGNSLHRRTKEQKAESAKEEIKRWEQLGKETGVGEYSQGVNKTC